MKKLNFPSEIAYIIGLLLLSLGTCLATKADFGVSMIAAPAYLIHILLTKTISVYFTFGRCEIMLEALVIIIMCIILKKFRFGYLFSLMAGVIYGIFLDMWIFIFGNFEVVSYVSRVIIFALAQIVTAYGLALTFKSYFPPAAYDFFVKEVSKHYHIKLSTFKTGFDITFCIISIILSFTIFGFGHFEGIKIGTVVIALINGTTIGIATEHIDKHIHFYDMFKLRRIFN